MKKNALQPVLKRELKPVKTPILRDKKKNPANSLLIVTGMIVVTCSSMPAFAKSEYVHRKEYEKLEREVERLVAQMQSLMEQQSSSETHIAQASPDGSATEEDSQTENGLGVDEGSREEEAEDMKRQLDTFLRRQKVLFKQGELEVEFGINYSQSTTRTACFNPKPGSVFCPSDPKKRQTFPKIDSRSVGTSFSVSYGIIDDLALSLSIPYSYSEEEGDFSPFRPEDNRNLVKHSNHIGIGDISGSLRYTAWHESGATPGVTVKLSVKVPSGDDSKGLGSGFWNIGTGISLTKTIDPVVFFGSLGYTARLPSGTIDLGDQITYSVGGGFSINNRVSIAVALSGSAVFRNEDRGVETPGSSQNTASLQFSSTIKLTKSLFVEPFVAFGLTEGASDFTFGINVPFRFEEKYPLPFLPEY